MDVHAKKESLRTDFMKEKKLRFGIPIVLLLTITLLALHTLPGAKISLAGIEIKQPSLDGFFEKEQSLAKKNDTLVNDSGKALAVKTRPAMDTSRQRILMIGESMIEGLYLSFLDYAKYNHHNLKAKIWYGSSTKDWAESDTIAKLIKAYDPTFIMVSIGANELFIRNIQKREPYIQKIIEQLGDRKYIWIGPPDWKKDTGINDLIEDNVPPEQFFLSKNMHFKRKKDGAHPVMESSRMWADSIAVWITQDSPYPIRMLKPAKAGEQVTADIISQTGKNKQCNP
jgi:hypothetical protein